HDSGVEAAAEKAGKAGMKIFTIGVGTAEGELIRVTDEQGTGAFLKDDSGNAVKSRLDETLLRKIAVNGFYLPLLGAKPMEALYAQGLAPLPKSDATTKLVRQYRERFHWPLGAAILLLILEMFLPHRKRINRPEMNPNNPGLDAGKPALRSLPVGALILLAACSAVASPASALRDYEAGNFHSAMDEFKKLSQEKTNDLRLSYNAGTAAYRAKQFEDAQKYLSAAAAAPDLKLQQQAYYNLGNASFEAGEAMPEPDKKKEAWEGSAKNFKNALKLNSEDADARHNLALVQKKLEELKKQQDQQQKQQPKDDKSKDSEKKENQDSQKKGEQKDPSKSPDSKSPQNDSEKKDDPSQKQDQAKNEKDKKEQQKKKAEQQAKDQQKKESEGKQGQQNEDGKSPEQEQEEAMAMAEGKMTPEQARQFLDTQKQDDKPLIFAPAKKTSPQSGKFKDW
ncbi:MAG: hypothetical protein ABIV39_07175, partial [Verrucomicrobiota bacterium]